MGTRQDTLCATEDMMTEGIMRPRSSHRRTLWGRPKAGWCAQRCSMTSRSSAFCPLYVVRMEIFSAGYPSSRMYWNTDTTYSASPRFW